MSIDPLRTRSNFCKSCNALLDTPDTDEIYCACCGKTCSYGDIAPENLIVETSSAQRSDPQWVVERRKAEAGGGEEQKRATVDEICEKCGHNKATFYTMQMRSVDEGQTVFYECLKCGNKWSQNN